MPTITLSVPEFIEVVTQLVIAHSEDLDARSEYGTVTPEEARSLLNQAVLEKAVALAAYQLDHLPTICL